VKFGSLRQFWQVDFLHILTALGCEIGISFFDSRRSMWTVLGERLWWGIFYSSMKIFRSRRSGGYGGRNGDSGNGDAVITILKRWELGSLCDMIWLLCVALHWIYVSGALGRGA